MKILIEKRELIGIGLIFKDYPNVKSQSKGFVKDVEIDVVGPYGHMDPILIVLTSEEFIIPVSIDEMLVKGNVVATTQKEQALLEDWLTRYFRFIESLKTSMENCEEINKRHHRFNKKTNANYLEDVVDLLNNSGLKINRCSIDKSNLKLPFSSRSACEKAHEILKQNDIQHFMFNCKSLNQTYDSFCYIFFPKSKKPYKSNMCNKTFIWYVVSSLGEFLMRMFDIAYNEGLETISIDQLNDLNSSLIFVQNLKDDDTGYPLDIITLVDHFYTAGSSTKSYFTSNDIAKETVVYGNFVMMCLGGSSFENAFINAKLNNERERK